jgi:hypothetical protein
MDVADDRTTTAHNRGLWIGLGAVTLAAMFLAWLALDDITTDNATRFPVEYTILVMCAAWLMIVAGQLWRSGSRMNSALTVASIASAAFMAVGGIGHKRDGGWAVFWPQYLPLTWAWVHGIVIGALMIRRGMRGTGAG